MNNSGAAGREPRLDFGIGDATSGRWAAPHARPKILLDSHDTVRFDNLRRSLLFGDEERPE
jgi:hypothetical protein